MATATKAARRPAYRNPDVGEARARRGRRQVKPYRQLSNQQIGTKVAAGRRARAKAAAQPAAPAPAAAAAQPFRPPRPQPRQPPPQPEPRPRQPARDGAGGGSAGAYRRNVAGPARRAFLARTAGQEGAGAVLALFLYPLLINGLRGGPERARGWLAAKFLNRPYAAGPAARGGRGGRGGKAPPAPRRPGTIPGIRP